MLELRKVNAEHTIQINTLNTCAKLNRPHVVEISHEEPENDAELQSAD